MGRQAREARETFAKWPTPRLQSESPEGARVGYESNLNITQIRFDIDWGKLGQRKSLVLLLEPDAIDDYLGPELTREKSTAKLMVKVRRPIKALLSAAGSRTVSISREEVA